VCVISRGPVSVNCSGNYPPSFSLTGGRKARVNRAFGLCGRRKGGGGLGKCDCGKKYIIIALTEE